METRANYIAVGMLTIAAIAAAFIFIYWLGNYGDRGNAKPLVVRIEGSVSGLSIGSSVQFNGITIGRVVELGLDAGDPRFVRVGTMVRSDVPVRQDTRATIGTRGLSGGAFVQLEGGSPQAANILQQPGAVPPVLDGKPSSINEIVSRVNAIADRTERVMGGLELLITENKEKINTTISNAETFSQALADNSDGVNRLLSNAERMANSIEGLSTKLDGTITQAEKIVAAIDPATVKKTMDDISQTMDNARGVTKIFADNSQGIERILKNTDELTSSLKGVPEKLDSTVTRAQEIVAAIDPQKVGKTVDDLSATAGSAREILEGIDAKSVGTLISELSDASSKISTLVAAIDAQKVNKAMDQFSTTAEGAQQIVADVSKVTSKFGERSQDIDQMITDASELAARLNKSSVKIDGVLDKVDELLGSGEANGLFAEARATLADFRRTAKNFDRQINSVASGINRFTGRGLQGTQGLISDARQSIQRLDRVIRKIEDNPSSLITGSGGSGIRESAGGRPRR